MKKCDVLHMPPRAASAQKIAHTPVGLTLLLVHPLIATLLAVRCYWRTWRGFDIDQDGSKAMDHIKALQQIYAYVEAGDVGNAVMGCLRVAKSTPQSKRRAR